MLYCVYLYFGIQGVATLREKFDLSTFFRYDSFLYHFSLHEKNNSPEYTLRLEIFVTSPLDYSDVQVQTEIFDILKNITELDYVTAEFSENWLQSFLSWAKIYEEFEPIDISTEEGFIDALRTAYLSNASHLSTDIVFNENNTKIIASRYILQTKGFQEGVDDLKSVIKQTRAITGAVKNFDVHVNTYFSRYIDEMIMIQELAIKLMIVASGTVLVISIVFIPSLLVSTCVFISIVSTQLGVVGFMSHWGVPLDPLSLVSLVMCIGFSVDPTAHVSYAFVCTKEGLDVEGKIRSALHAVGLPVVQGALSTLIGMSAVLFVPSGTFHTVFKVVYLVMLFSAAHSLLLLPIVLSLAESFRCCRVKSKSTYDVTA